MRQIQIQFVVLWQLGQIPISCESSARFLGSLRNFNGRYGLMGSSFKSELFIFILKFSIASKVSEIFCRTAGGILSSSFHRIKSYTLQALKISETMCRQQALIIPVSSSLYFWCYYSMVFINFLIQMFSVNLFLRAESKKQQGKA